MAHVTIINSDRKVLCSLRDMLEGEGHKVDTHTDSMRALISLRQRQTDLAVMDVKMPRMDGLSLLEKLRTTDNASVPVVFLSDDNDQTDELIALRMGADDYVHKPYVPRILMQRLRNCLRRSEMRQAPSVENADSSPPLQRGVLEIDPNTMRVKWRGIEITLTSSEFKLLHYLAQTPDYVRSRQQLMNQIYGNGINVEERVVDSHLKRVRKKIRAIDPDFSAIETIYGSGYRLVAARTQPQ